jgi:hypothetical protein
MKNRIIGLLVSLFLLAAMPVFGQQVILPPTLTNLSVRTVVSDTQKAYIGFVIAGDGATNGSKSVVLRAAGPALGLPPFNVAGVASDPKIELYRGNTMIASNDNWGGSQVLRDAAARVGAFAISDGNSRDAMLFIDLQPGNYTVVMYNTGGAGTALFEVYDAQQTSFKLVNMSFRGHIPSGIGATVGASFVGRGGVDFLVRAVGPGLGQFGVTNFLPNPMIKSVNYTSAIQSDGKETRTIVSDDDWSGQERREVMARVGAFAIPEGRDAVVYIQNAKVAGVTAVTANVTGVGQPDFGEAIIEFYIVDSRL